MLESAAWTGWTPMRIANKSEAQTRIADPPLVRARSAGRGDSRTAAEPAEPSPGELLAIYSAGAYGAVQSGTYNSRLLVPEVLVNGGDFALVRPRPTYDDLIGLDRLPDWLS